MNKQNYLHNYLAFDRVQRAIDELEDLSNWTVSEIAQREQITSLVAQLKRLQRSYADAQDAAEAEVESPARYSYAIELWGRSYLITRTNLSTKLRQFKANLPNGWCSTKEWATHFTKDEAQYHIQELRKGNS